MPEAVTVNVTARARFRGQMIEPGLRSMTEQEAKRLIRGGFAEMPITEEHDEGMRSQLDGGNRGGSKSTRVRKKVHGRAVQSAHTR